MKTMEALEIGWSVRQAARHGQWLRSFDRRAASLSLSNIGGVPGVLTASSPSAPLHRSESIRLRIGLTRCQPVDGVRSQVHHQWGSERHARHSRGNTSKGRQRPPSASAISVISVIKSAMEESDDSLEECVDVDIMLGGWLEERRDGGILRFGG
jgi:hypothetical protein